MTPATYYARARKNGPVHIVEDIEYGERGRCGVPIPPGQNITADPEEYLVRPCPNCERALAREAGRRAGTRKKGGTW